MSRKLLSNKFLSHKVLSQGQSCKTLLVHKTSSNKLLDHKTGNNRIIISYNVVIHEPLIHKPLSNEQFHLELLSHDKNDRGRGLPLEPFTTKLQNTES